MKNVLTALRHSIVGLLFTWLGLNAALLPVNDVGDGYGHGPDIGSGEWHRAVIKQTQKRKNFSLGAGLLVGVIVFPVSYVARRRRRNK